MLIVLQLSTAEHASVNVIIVSSWRVRHALQLLRVMTIAYHIMTLRL